MDSELLSNIYATIQTFWAPIRAGGVLLGLLLFGMGLIRLAKTGGQGGQSGKAVAAGFIAGGILLINTNEILSMFTLSLLGTGGGDFSFNASVASGPGQAYVMAAVAAIKCIGAFGFIRGCYLLGTTAGEGRIALWGGLVHIIGGVLALNFEIFAVMLGDTLGGTFGQAVRELFN